MLLCYVLNENLISFLPIRFNIGRVNCLEKQSIKFRVHLETASHQSVDVNKHITDYSLVKIKHRLYATRVRSVTQQKQTI